MKKAIRLENIIANKSLISDAKRAEVSSKLSIASINLRYQLV